MTTVTIGGRTTDTFSGFNDATIREDFPSILGGASNPLYISSIAASSVQRTIVQVSGISNIPSNAIVSAATLTLKRVNSATPAKDVEMRRLLASPTFASVSWNNRSAGTPWGTAGALGAVDSDPTIVVTASAPTGSNTFMHMSSAGLVALVQGWVNGTIENHGVLLKLVDETPSGQEADFYATDEATNTQRPFLTVTYDIPVLPDITVSDVTINNLSGTATFVVSLSSTFASNVTVDYATADQTATAGVDYTATSGTLTFTPGQTSKTVIVSIPQGGGGGESTYVLADYVISDYVV